MSRSRTTLIGPTSDEPTAEENPLLKQLVAAMNRCVPSEKDRKLLLALGRAIRQLREERGMTPAELPAPPASDGRSLKRSKPDDHTLAYDGLGIEPRVARERPRRVDASAA